MAALVAGCGGGGKTYDRQQVSAAFERHGYRLTEWEIPAGSAAAQEGDLLVPIGSRPRFWVAVGTDAGAEEAWPDFEDQQDADSFDARRVNVMVVSDGGMSAGQIERVLAALRSLGSQGEIQIAARRSDFSRP
jgi:hypothetical protein